MTTPPSATRPKRSRLRLENVTLCAVSSSNLAATVRALEASLAQIEFAEALLFTDQEPAAIGVAASSEIEVVAIEPIRSSEAYSRFILEELAERIGTSHCLIVQWDGHVIDAGRWREEFLEYDYIGASWPQFHDGHEVGNGGFSLRSRRLIEACRRPGFAVHHPEDVAICRTNRVFLEGLGLRFAPVELANRFSAERASDPSGTFGYHGVFLMPQVLGERSFWEVYQSLSDKGSVWIDFGLLLRAVLRRPGGVRRALTLAFDRFISG